MRHKDLQSYTAAVAAAITSNPIRAAAVRGHTGNNAIAVQLVTTYNFTHGKPVAIAAADAATLMLMPKVPVKTVYGIYRGKVTQVAKNVYSMAGAGFANANDAAEMITAGLH